MSVKVRWALYGIVLPFTIICVILAIALIGSVAIEYWLPAILWTLITLGAVFLIGLAFHWFPSSPNDAGYEEFLQTGDPNQIDFCEGFEPGWIKQPISVWSDLAFVAAGLLIVLIAGTRPTPAANPMADPASFLPLLYGLIVIFMGPASMFFHASMKAWAAWFDNFSIIAWAAFGLSYTTSHLLSAWFGWADATLWILFAAIIIVTGAVTWFVPDTRRASQIITAGAWFLIELLLMIAIWTGNAPGFQRDSGWFALSVLAFAFAFACWLPSGGAWRFWCDPDSPLQGHGFWHVLSAVGAVMIYCYFASEIALAA